MGSQQLSVQALGRTLIPSPYIASVDKVELVSFPQLAAIIIQAASPSAVVIHDHKVSSCSHSSLSLRLRHIITSQRQMQLVVIHRKCLPATNDAIAWVVYWASNIATDNQGTPTTTREHVASQEPLINPRQVHIEVRGRGAAQQ